MKKFTFRDIENRSKQFDLVTPEIRATNVLQDPYFFKTIHHG